VLCRQLVKHGLQLVGLCMLPTFSTGLHASSHIHGVSEQTVAWHHQPDDAGHNGTAVQTCVHTMFRHIAVVLNVTITESLVLETETYYVM